MPILQRRIQLRRANLVGTIHSAGGFAAAARAGIDLVELRLDALKRPPSETRLAGLPSPVILTVRRLDEGGARALPDSERAALYLDFLYIAAAVDIEMRSMRALRNVAIAAQNEKKPLIASFHDFRATPPLAKLREIEAKARLGGADIVKLATTTRTAGDVASLLTLLDESRAPLAVMGMGPLGRASRLLFAKAGSVLNYGWLDKPQAPGQWAAAEFRDLLARA